MSKPTPTRADATYHAEAYDPDSDDTAKCAACGKMNDPDAKFCDQCGRGMVPTAAYSADADETVECPSCHRMNDPDAIFCDQCGIKMEDRVGVNDGAGVAANSTPTTGEMADVLKSAAPELAELYAKRSVTGTEKPPREGLIRALQGCEVREASGDDSPGPGTLHGYLAVFNDWTEINSMWEGNFMERLAPGAFARTIANNRDQIKVTFNHGGDPSLGDKPLGPITALSEDAHGVSYEVPLLDTEYNRELAPGLKAGLYGSSFRFQVMADDFNKKAKASAYNPNGLPERTIREVRMQEFGPVTFPAYPNASAGMRSMTDEFLMARYLEDPGKLQRLVNFNVAESDHLTPARGEAKPEVPAKPNSAPVTVSPSKTAATPKARRSAPKPVTTKPPERNVPKLTNDERRDRIAELETWVRQTDETYAEEGMPDEIHLE